MPLSTSDVEAIFAARISYSWLMTVRHYCYAIHMRPYIRIMGWILIGLTTYYFKSNFKNTADFQIKFFSHFSQNILLYLWLLMLLSKEC